MLWLGVALACAVPATADAATLVNEGGRLVYTGEPGEANTVEFETYQGGAVLVGPMHGSSSGCEAARTTQFWCRGVSSITADLGDGDDVAFVGGLAGYTSSLSGGPGDDQLYVLLPAYGGEISGGPGLDAAGISTRNGEPITISLDGAPNDGGPGTGIDVASDVEDLTASTSGTASLTGNAGANTLTGGSGDDRLVGGPGADVLRGRDGNDTLDARDGEADVVECGNGVDIALVDQFDQVGESCEQTQLAELPSALDDLPPAIAFLPGNGLAVTATDDRGIASVRFSAGETTLCTDTTAPYTCPFTPGVADVGRKTIVAVAVDTGGQTATAVRSFVVPRFKPIAVSLSVKRDGKRYVAGGKVRLPGLACAGDVTVSVGKTRRKAKLSRTCLYRVVLASGGRFVTTYSGTAAIEPKRSAARTVR
jgi:Ca2+-binding RTX toxin-like protein